MSGKRKRRNGSVMERRAALEQTTLAAFEIARRTALDQAGKIAKLRALRLNHDQVGQSDCLNHPSKR